VVAEGERGGIGHCWKIGYSLLYVAEGEKGSFILEVGICILFMVRWIGGE
jgi:hypothetical protein